MRSLSEIGVLEKAYECGAKTLGTAVEALRDRWAAGLRDEETFIRFAFLCWYSRSEPGHLTGLDAAGPLPTVDDLYREVNGPDALEPETLFVLGLLSHGYAFCCGPEDLWQARSAELFDLAEHRAPNSAVLSNWRFLLGLTKEVEGLRRRIGPELHARFHGRGYMGSYVMHICESASRVSAGGL